MSPQKDTSATILRTSGKWHRLSRTGRLLSHKRRLEPYTGFFGGRSSKTAAKKQENERLGKGVRRMHEEKAGRRRQAMAIEQGARSANNGRSYLLLGLWACRLASGLSQRDLAKRIGTNQSTVRMLERGQRGAYVSTLRRLCQALEVEPEDLLCGNSGKKEEARR